jgi:hypothetical protein
MAPGNRSMERRIIVLSAGIEIGAMVKKHCCRLQVSPDSYLVERIVIERAFVRCSPGRLRREVTQRIYLL